MKEINFEEIREDIQKALAERLNQNNFPNEGKGFILLGGFFMSPMQSKVSNKIALSGSSVPMVSAIGKETGRVYFFALKVLLPDLDFGGNSDER